LDSELDILTRKAKKPKGFLSYFKTKTFFRISRTFRLKKDDPIQANRTKTTEGSKLAEKPIQL